MGAVQLWDSPHKVPQMPVKLFDLEYMKELTLFRIDPSIYIQMLMNIFSTWEVGHVVYGWLVQKSELSGLNFFLKNYSFIRSPKYQ